MIISTTGTKAKFPAGTMQTAAFWQLQAESHQQTDLCFFSYLGKVKYKWMSMKSLSNLYNDNHLFKLLLSGKCYIGRVSQFSSTMEQSNRPGIEPGIKLHDC